MQKIIIGNLKMNIVSSSEREQYLKVFQKELSKKKLVNAQIVLCPPVIHLETFGRVLGKKVTLGGQNCFWKEEGSYTGEISPAMLKNFGCDYVICGHSERRKYFGETDQAINLKVSAVLKNKLVPIICVGETLEERRAGLTLPIITEQLKEIFAGIAQSNLKNIVIAYEPVWSVGSDVIPSANEIMEARVLIRKILLASYAKKNMEKVRIIYGGSVNSKTVEKTCVASGMDGALIGRESLTPKEFLKICKIIEG